MPSHIYTCVDSVTQDALWAGSLTICTKYWELRWPSTRLALWNPSGSLNTEYVDKYRTHSKYFSLADVVTEKKFDGVGSGHTQVLSNRDVQYVVMCCSSTPIIWLGNLCMMIYNGMLVLPVGIHVHGPLPWYRQLVC